MDKSIFTPSKARYDGLQAYCRECMKAYRIEHYRANKDAHYERNRKAKERLREHVLELKKGNCFDCEISYPDEPWLMEFDHRDPSEKIESIYTAVSYGSMKRLEKELSKCDLVCVVCHRRRSALRGNWSLNRFKIDIALN